MEKLKIGILASLMFFAAVTAQAHDKVISFAQLPAKAQAFVQNNFDKAHVASVSVDTEHLWKKEYTVIFNNGTKVEFDGKGNWEEMSSKTEAIPVKLTPAAILQHIHKSFPNTFVKELKRGNKMYEVEISNGLELEFNLQGEFIRIDD